MSLPYQLTHSWPLFEHARRFDLGHLFALPADSPPLDADLLAAHGIGRWSCDLADDSLQWTAGVFDLFGLPRDIQPPRLTTVALYTECSRTKMERLRAYAIRHRRGFTLDAEIAPVGGARRRMRLIAGPELDAAGRVVRIAGLKLDLARVAR